MIGTSDFLDGFLSKKKNKREFFRPNLMENPI